MSSQSGSSPRPAGELGPRLRGLRIAQRITQQDMAERTGLSKSFVSAVELDRARPSIASISKMAAVLGVPLGVFFETLDAGDEPAHPDDRAVPPAATPVLDEVAVVRADRRKVIMWPGRDFKTFLLTPDLQRKLQVITTEFEPGYEDDGEMEYSHVGEEFTLVLQGTYEVTVDGTPYVLEAGDTIYYPSHLPHRTRVLSDVSVQTLTVVTPPSF